MTPEEKRYIYPPFIVRETEKIDPPNFLQTKVADFLSLIRSIWKISNNDYQEQFWVKQDSPIRGDNYMETMETFLGDSEAVLEANEAGRVSMTKKQRKLLQELCDKVDAFWDDPDTPASEYGENDEAIVNDPKWQKIGEYAKLVYEELSGDDLDKWEKQRK